MRLAELRRRADLSLRALHTSADAPSVADLARLVHELSIHEAELTLQNEQLRKAELELSVARNRYWGLFDLAPVGYATIDAQGFVQEVNAKLACMLATQAESIQGRRFSAYLEADDTDAFHRFRRRLDEHATHDPVEFELSGVHGGGTIPVELRGVRVTQEEFLLSVRDLRAEKQAQQLEADMMGRFHEARELEREYIATELHDEVGQTIAAVAVGLRAIEGQLAPEVAERVVCLRSITGKALDEVRRLSRGMHTSIVEHIGIVSALRGLIDDTQAVMDIRLSMEVPDTDLTELPDKVAHLIYRATQQCLANALRHGAPQHIAVELVADGGGVRLVIRDDGRGFEPSAETRRNGLGLWSLMGRARSLGGSMEVESVLGGGTTVILRVPRYWAS